MKLLFCEECNDLFKLSPRGVKRCECKRSAGQYLCDGLHVEISGPSRVVGVVNGSLAKGLRQRQPEGAVAPVEAFVLARRHQRVVPVKAERFTPKEQQENLLMARLLAPELFSGATKKQDGVD